MDCSKKSHQNEFEKFTKSCELTLGAKRIKTNTQQDFIVKKRAEDHNMEGKDNNKELITFKDEALFEVIVSSADTNVNPETANGISQIKKKMMCYFDEDHSYTNSSQEPTNNEETINNEELSSRKMIENSIYRSMYHPWDGLQELSSLHIHGAVKLNCKKVPDVISHCTGHSDLELYEHENLPQPGQIFESRDKFMEYMNNNAKQWNFYITCEFSQIHSPRTKSSSYTCVNHAPKAYRKSRKSKGIRRNDSKKTMCPCTIKLRQLILTGDAVIVTYVCYHHDHPLTKEHFLKLPHGKHFPEHFKREIKDLLYLGVHSLVMMKYIFSQTGYQMSYKYCYNMKRVARMHPRHMSEYELKQLMAKCSELENLYGNCIPKKKACGVSVKSKKATKNYGKKSVTQHNRSKYMSTDKNTSGESGQFIQKANINSDRSNEPILIKKRTNPDQPALDGTSKKSRLEACLEKFSHDEETFQFANGKYYVHQNEASDNIVIIETSQVYDHYITNGASENHEGDSTEIENYHDGNDHTVEYENIIESDHEDDLTETENYQDGNDDTVEYENIDEDNHEDDLTETENYHDGNDHTVEYENIDEDDHEDDLTETENYHDGHDYNHTVEYKNINKDDFNECNQLILPDSIETYEGNENAHLEIPYVDTVIDNSCENVLTETATQNEEITDRSITDQATQGEVQDRNKMKVEPNNSHFDLDTDETLTHENGHHIYINKYNVGERIIDPDISKYLEQVAKERGESILDILRNIYKGTCGISIKITRELNQKHITVTYVKDKLPGFHSKKWNEIVKYKREASLYCNLLIGIKEELAQNREEVANLKTELAICSGKNTKLQSDMKILNNQNTELKANLCKEKTRLNALLQASEDLMKKAADKIYELSEENNGLKRQRQNLAHVEQSNQNTKKGKDVSKSKKELQVDIDYVRKRKNQIESDFNELIVARQILLKDISNACDLKTLELVKGKIRETLNENNKLKHTQASNKNKRVKNKGLDVFEIASSRNSDKDEDEISLKMEVSDCGADPLSLVGNIDEKDKLNVSSEVCEDGDLTDDIGEDSDNYEMEVLDPDFEFCT